MKLGDLHDDLFDPLEDALARVAPAMTLLSRVSSPLVWLLHSSGKLVLALLGQSAEPQNRVTEEEVRTLLAEAHEGGIIETEEQEMLSGVMRLADRSARALMTPRRDVEMLDLDAAPDDTLQAIRRIARPRIPVRNPDTDEVLGVLYLTDAFASLSRGEPVDLVALMREVPVVSDRADAVDVLAVLRGATHHLALVYDEYGHFEGIITSGDVLEAILHILPERGLLEGALNYLVHVALHPKGLRAKSDVVIDGLGEGVWLLEHHADYLANLYRVDILAIHILAVVQNLATNLGRWNQVVHAV
jgi:CBS domain-containing protein